MLNIEVNIIEGNPSFFIPRDAFMTYLMKKFPNLESIALENCGELFPGVIEGLGTQPVAVIS